MKVLDLFSGAGGFSLGFEMAGMEILGGIEIDKWAGETFVANHSNAKLLNDDIVNYSNEYILEQFQYNKPDIIIGGPPCQGFSISNRNAGDPKDPRNSLFVEYLRVVSIFQPEYIVMENVPNLLKAKNADEELVIEIIKREIKNLGYHVYVGVLEATDFGVPQIRKRLFIIGSKEKLHDPFPLPTHHISNESYDLFNQKLQTTPTLWEAISDLPDIDAREGNEEMHYSKPANNDYQKFLRDNSNEVVYNHKAMNHSKRVVERFKNMIYGSSFEDIPEHLRPYKRNQKGIVSDSMYEQNNRRMHPDKPCHTITASFYANFIHPFKHRNFTAREGARVQSFPDSYVFKGKPTVVSKKLLAKEGRHNESYLCQYNQIGNAVPPLLAKAVAENFQRIRSSKSVKC